MARKPPNFEWLGFNEEQLELLNFIDFIGNNGWGRNGQTDALMVGTLQECVDAGMDIDVVVEAMAAIGYGRSALHQLRRWESKRTTGKFGK